LVPAREKYSSSSSPNAGGARVEYDTDDPSEERGDTTDEATTDDDGSDDLRFFKHSLSFLKNDSVYHDGIVVCQQTRIRFRSEQEIYLRGEETRG
jgi:hypothetical protein